MFDVVVTELKKKNPAYLETRGKLNKKEIQGSLIKFIQKSRGTQDNPSVIRDSDRSPSSMY